MYLELFWSFFQIGALSFGGGLAALPLIQAQMVDLHGWLTLTEFTDLVTIAQMTPGPIAINAATFVGTQIGGLGGAIVATLGCVLPSCIIVSVLAYLYFRFEKLTLVQGILGGLRPAVVAMIAAAGMDIFLHSIFGQGGYQFSFSHMDFLACMLFAVGLFLLRWKQPNPIFVMLGCGFVGAVVYPFLG